LRALTKYRAYLERAYDRHGVGAIRIVSLWWFICLLPLCLTGPDSPLSMPLFWILSGIMFVGVAYSGWQLWGISIRRSNAEVQRLEDEEWARFDQKLK